VALADLEPGNAGVLRRVSDSDPEMLRYLADRGIVPGTPVRLVGTEPFGGPLMVEVEGREHALGAELARKMRVQPDDQAA
jgi:DtxR family Mn-dependent transcriptional regulator